MQLMHFFLSLLDLPDWLLFRRYLLSNIGSSCTSCGSYCRECSQQTGLCSKCLEGFMLVEGDCVLCTSDVCSCQLGAIYYSLYSWGRVMEVGVALGLMIFLIAL